LVVFFILVPFFYTQKINTARKNIIYVNFLDNCFFFVGNSIIKDWVLVREKKGLESKYPPKKKKSVYIEIEISNQEYGFLLYMVLQPLSKKNGTTISYYK